MTTQQNNKTINIALWIVQILLAIMFLMAGIMKASQPLDAMIESMPWIASTPLSLVRFIGVSEILGGLGLVLPSVLRIKPFLTIWAAIGLIIVMLLAAIFHATRGEFSAIGMNVLLIALAAFIAWGRNKKSPILEKA